MDTFTRTESFQTFWPIDEGREKDLYFYLQAIEEYLPDNRVRVAGHGEMLMLGSYSYLGLNGHPAINRAAHKAIDKYGTGTHGVRLLSGTLALHRQLEARIATFVQTESACTFSSGYLANVATIACIIGRHDTVICDKLDHASIIDGCRLSQARFVRFNHNDMQDLEKCLSNPDLTGRKLVVVDAVFSMDGDIIDLPLVSKICRAYGAWLMVDESHSIGVLGRTGHGIQEHFGLGSDSIDIKMGSLGKTIPSVGGYIAGTQGLCRFVSHESRAFIYSASLPPPAAAAALEAINIMESEPERVTRLHDNISYFATQLNCVGLPFLKSTTAIFPIICGDNWRAWEMARYCQRQGVYVQAIPHPVVPKGLARLRAVTTASHQKQDLDFSISVLADAAQNIGMLSETNNRP